MKSLNAFGRGIIYALFFVCTYILNLIICGLFGSIYYDGINKITGNIYAITMILVPPILSTVETIAFAKKWALKRNVSNSGSSQNSHLDSVGTYIQNAQDLPPVEPVILSHTSRIQNSIVSPQVFREYGGTEAELLTIDLMEGHAFEYWCAEALRKQGFSNVEVTPCSGDQVVDVLASKDGIKYAIQCKCYSSNLGNTPIQEVTAGKSFYHCHVGAVMTNRYFTPKARELAEATGTLLWDRDWIINHLNTQNPSSI